jgi:preprotein translocase subunit SecG
MDSLLLSTDHLVVAGALNDVLVWTFRFLFFASAVLLMVIVLLQEGKGGGLASALGGQGAETFGVSTGGVNRVTLFLAGLFLVSALGHAMAFEPTVTKGMRDKKARTTEDPFKGIKLPKEGEDEGVKTPPKEPEKAPEKPAETPPAPPKEPAKEEPPKAPSPESPK